MKILSILHGSEIFANIANTGGTKMDPRLALHTALCRTKESVKSLIKLTGRTRLWNPTKWRWYDNFLQILDTWLVQVNRLSNIKTKIFLLKCDLQVISLITISSHSTDPECLQRRGMNHVTQDFFTIQFHLIITISYPRIIEL